MKNKTKRFLKNVLLVSLALSSVSIMGGCGSKKNDSLKIAVLSKKQAEVSNYWKIIKKGSEDAGKEIGAEVIFDAPQDPANLEQQIELVNKYANEGVSAIVIAPIDKDALNDSLNAASENGIPIIAIDSDTNAESKKTCISTDNYAGGKTAGKAAADIAGGDIKAFIVSDSETAQNTADRIRGFTEAASDGNIEVSDVQYCDSDRGKAKGIALGAIKADDKNEIKVMFGANEASTLGICDAIAEEGLEDTISVIGFDCSDDVIDFMNKNVIDATIVQNPYNMGYLGVKNAQKICNKESVSSAIDTGVTRVTLDNLDDKDIQFLINPLGN